MSSILEALIDQNKVLPPQSEVPVPELGEGQVIHLCPIGMATALRLNEMQEGGKSGAEIARALLPAVICRPDGTPFFTAAKPPTEAQQAALDRIPLPVAVRVVDQAIKGMEAMRADAKKSSPETAG
ncbi:hypothetical protein [Limnoglobus roseus]|uniref:Uncharacterized protein n=1 Tax=Limnoglobus roseus TaxID=2598579 RepID=A0A5C1AND6_9BACT|nr:hypothetical protein [Limnoglobus roseus]QEL19506.1 hypothetical protein PX52LOC_06580 [Limnoglobus roseus]